MRVSVVIVCLLLAGCTKPEPPAPVGTPPLPTPAHAEAFGECARVQLDATPAVIRPGENATLRLRVANCGNATLARDTPSLGRDWSPVFYVEDVAYTLLNGTHPMLTGAAWRTDSLVSPAMIGNWSIAPGELNEESWPWNGMLQTCGRPADCPPEPAPPGNYTLRSRIAGMGYEPTEWSANVRVTVLSP